jgi:hypothetical protein
VQITTVDAHACNLASGHRIQAASACLLGSMGLVTMFAGEI